MPPPDPLPIVGSLQDPPPLVVLGARRSAAFVELRFPDARLEQARGGTGSLALPQLRNWAPLGGRDEAL